MAPEQVWTFWILGRPASSIVTVNGKGKGKVHPRTGHEGPEGSRSKNISFFKTLRTGDADLRF